MRVWGPGKAKKSVHEIAKDQGFKQKGAKGWVVDFKVENCRKEKPGVQARGVPAAPAKSPEHAPSLNRSPKRYFQPGEAKVERSAHGNSQNLVIYIKIQTLILGAIAPASNT